MTDYTAAVDTLAEFEYTRLRHSVIERNGLSEDQFYTYGELNPTSLLLLKEEALDSILSIEPLMENLVLSRIAEESSVPIEVLDFISSRMLSNELDAL